MAVGTTVVTIYSTDVAFQADFIDVTAASFKRVFFTPHEDASRLKKAYPLYHLDYLLSFFIKVSFHYCYLVLLSSSEQLELPEIVSLLNGLHPIPIYLCFFRIVRVEVDS